MSVRPSGAPLDVETTASSPPDLNPMGEGPLDLTPLLDAAPIAPDDFAGPPLSWSLLRKNLSASGLGYVIGALAGFFAQAALARHLGAATYGVYISAFALVTVIAVLDDVGGSGYLVREAARDLRRLNDVLCDLLLVRVGAAIVVTILSLAIAHALGFSAAGMQVVALMTVMMNANAWVRTMRSALQAIERLHVAAGIAIANSVLSAASMVAVLAAGGGVVAAVLASTLISVVLVPVAWVILVRRVSVHFRPSFRRALRLTVDTMPFTMISVLTFATSYVDALIIRGIHGDAAAGLYGSAYRLIVIIQFLPSIYLDSVYRSLCAASASRRDAFRSLVDRSAAGLFLLGLPFAIGGAIVGSRIVTGVFGSQFEAAAPAFSILLWTLPCAFSGWVLLPALISGDRPQTATAIFSVAFALNVAGNLAFVPHFGSRAAAVVTVLTDGFLAVATTWALGRQGVHLRWPRLVAWGPVAGGAMALVVVLFRHSPLVIPVVVGAGVYGLALILLGVPARFGWSPGRAGLAR